MPLLSLTKTHKTNNDNVVRSALLLWPFCETPFPLNTYFFNKMHKRTIHVYKTWPINVPTALS